MPMVAHGRAVTEKRRFYDNYTSTASPHKPVPADAVVRVGDIPLGSQVPVKFDAVERLLSRPFYVKRAQDGAVRVGSVVEDERVEKKDDPSSVQRDRYVVVLQKDGEITRLTRCCYADDDYWSHDKDAIWQLPGCSPSDSIKDAPTLGLLDEETRIVIIRQMITDAAWRGALVTIP